MRIPCAGFDDLLAPTRYNQKNTVVKSIPLYHSLLSIVAQCEELPCILTAASPCCAHRKWQVLAGNLRVTSVVDVSIDGSCGLTSRRVATPPGEHARILGSTRRPKVALDLGNDGGELGTLSECCLRVLMCPLWHRPPVVCRASGAFKRRPLSVAHSYIPGSPSPQQRIPWGLRPGP